MADSKRSTPRVREHVDKLREAGLDTQKFFDCLVGIRDDTALPKAHREAIYKLIAMESFVWYMEALRNERVDRIKMAEEVNKLGAEYEAAIRKKVAGEKSAALVSSDIGEGSTPPPAETINERRPRSEPPPGPQPRKGPGPRKK